LQEEEIKDLPLVLTSQSTVAWDHTIIITPKFPLIGIIALYLMAEVSTVNDSGSSVLTSLLESFDEVIATVEIDLKMEKQASSRYSWIPATMLSPLSIGCTVPVPPQHGEEADRSRWLLRRQSTQGKALAVDHPFITVIGNTGFIEGVHYWEVTLRTTMEALIDRVALGVVFPDDDANLNVKNLEGKLGDKDNDLLYNYAVEIHLELQNKCCCIRTRWMGPVFYFSSSSSLVGIRLGFLLDQVKSELKLFVYFPANNSNQPDREIFIANLLKGRKFYPAFSLPNKLETSDNALMLNTNPTIPSTIVAYKERMDDMMNLLRQIRASLDSAEMMAHNNTAEYHQLRERYQQLLNMLNLA
jgi:hypothetical protein